MERIRRAALVRSVDFDKRTVTLVASSDQLCPDNMIILSRAWEQDYETWLKGNPVVLGFHNYHEWAIGHVVEGRIEDGRLVETVAFDDVNPEAIIAWSLYSKGHQRAASVGWDTLEADLDLPIGEVLARYAQDLSADTVAQLTAEGKVTTGRKVGVVTRAKKVETSLVPVPMDDKAVVVHATIEDFLGRTATPELLQIAERAGLEFTKACTNCRGERPGWEETENQIRYRVKDPSLFKEDSFRTLPLDVKATGDVQLVRGRLKDNDEWATQAVHFNKTDGWTMDEAKTWWKEHEGDKHEKEEVETKSVEFISFDDDMAAIARVAERAEIVRGIDSILAGE